MSEEMRAKKKAEEEARQKEMEEEAKEAEKVLKDLESDICPHCLQPISSFPYKTVHPLGWMECAACGVVFAPKAIRNMKVRRATQVVKVPKFTL